MRRPNEMKTRNVIAVVLLGLAVGAAGVAWREARVAHVMADRQAAIERDVAETKQGLLAWTARREAAERATIAARAALVEVAKSSATPAMVPPGPALKR